MLLLQINREEVGGAQPGIQVDALSGLEATDTHITNENTYGLPGNDDRNPKQNRRSRNSKRLPLDDRSRERQGT